MKTNIISSSTSQRRLSTRLRILFVLLSGCGACLVPVDDEAGGRTNGKSDDDASTGDDASSGEADDPNQEGDDAGASNGEDNKSNDPDGAESGSGKSGDSDSSGCQIGKVRECFTYPDGTPIDYPGGTILGSCVPGVQECKDNEEWGKCIGAVAPKEKDTCEPGNDDNCNGKPTDHCNCSVGSQQDCGTDKGACEPGKMTCGEDGKWGDCEGERPPEPEICDGKIDQDCDGKPDSEDPDCDCINGSTDKECGSNVGACRKGHYVCKDGKWGDSCIGEIKPKAEICDGQQDEDCDGRKDKDDSDCECVDGGPPRLCRLAGNGDCALGTETCSGGKWGRCIPRFSKRAELCGTQRDQYGLGTGDEDCDGKIDEYYPGRPEGCTMYMLDADNDGWGAMGNNANTSSTNPTYGCFCGTVTEPGWRRFGATGSNQVNQDCGDCRNSDGHLVKPGAGFQSNPSRCLQEVRWRGGNFDYNCRSGEELEYPYEFSCRSSNGKCVARGYWSSSVPGCGQKAMGGGGCAVDEPDEDGICLGTHGISITAQRCK